MFRVVTIIALICVRKFDGGYVGIVCRRFRLISVLQFPSSFWHRRFHAGRLVVDHACVSRRSCGVPVYDASHALSITWQTVLILHVDRTHYYCTSNGDDRSFTTLSSCDQYYIVQTWLGRPLKLHTFRRWSTVDDGLKCGRLTPGWVVAGCSSSSSTVGAAVRRGSVAVQSSRCSCSVPAWSLLSGSPTVSPGSRCHRVPVTFRLGTGLPWMLCRASQPLRVRACLYRRSWVDSAGAYFQLIPVCPF